MLTTDAILVALIGAYVAVMFLSLRRFAHLDWRVSLVVAVVLGVGSGILVSPWAFIIFGWPGASLGAVVSSEVGLKSGYLVLTGAIISATAATAVLALTFTLLIVLLAKAWKSLGLR